MPFYLGPLKYFIQDLQQYPGNSFVVKAKYKFVFSLEMLSKIIYSLAAYSHIPFKSIQKSKNMKHLKLCTFKIQRKVVFFLSGFSLTNIHHLKVSRGRGGYFFNSTLPLPPACRHFDINQAHLCTQLTATFSPGIFGF